MRCLFVAALLGCTGCHLIYPFDAEPVSVAATDAGPDDDLSAADIQVDAPTDTGPEAAPDAVPGEAGVTTLAGTGVAGYKDGPADKAMFSKPAGIAVDSQGRIYVTEEANHTIRMIDKGMVSTVAGKEQVADFVDGSTLSARFYSPSGIAVDAAGDLVVADFFNHRIRLISGTTVSTLAGNGSLGDKNGPLLQASFNGPHEVATDGSGAIYVVEYNGNRVRMIQSGTVSTLAGSGTKGFKNGLAAAAEFDSPGGVATDLKGSVYVADSANSQLRLILGGTVSTAAGATQNAYKDGPALLARLRGPSDVALGPGGVLYICDHYDHRIRALKGGLVTTVAGDGFAGGKDGAPLQARLYYPHSLAVGPDGRIYVTDFEGHRVRVIKP